MIKTKSDLKEYLKWDAIALGHNYLEKPGFFRNEIWRFQIYLRKYEYYSNNRSLVSSLCYMYYKTQYHKWSIKLGFSIPINVFDKGLSIAHYGSIVVNSHAKIGKNCRIQENVTIGATGGNSMSPCVGDNVFIGSGARLLGDIRIGNNVSIGANAVVTKSFENDHITIAGIPAKIISMNGTDLFIKKGALDLYKNQ